MSTHSSTKARGRRLANFIDRKGFEKRIEVDDPPPVYQEIAVRMRPIKVGIVQENMNFPIGPAMEKLLFVLRHEYVDHVEYREDGF